MSTVIVVIAWQFILYDLLEYDDKTANDVLVPYIASLELHVVDV